MAVQYRPIPQANIKAVDYTKAGSVFSAALNKIGKAAEQVHQGRINVAGDDLTNAIREADTQDELALLNTDLIKQRGGSAEELTAAEAQLTGRKVDVFSKGQAESFTVDRERNVAALQSVVAANPELGVRLDEGNNPIFTDTNQQAKFGELLRETDFSPIRSSQEQTTFIRKRLTELGGTEEQIQREIQSNKTRRKEISTLNEIQQAEVAALDASIDTRVQQELNQVESKKDALTLEYGYTDPEATALLKTGKDAVYADIDKRGGEEQSWVWYLLAAGIDIKDNVKEMYAADPGLEPWMVQRAFNENINNDVGNQQVWESSFEDSINRIRNNSDLHRKIEAASQLDNNIDLEKMTVINRGNVDKASGLAKYRGDAGFTNSRRNADIFNSVLQQNAAAQQKTPTGGTSKSTSKSTGKGAAVTAPTDQTGKLSTAEQALNAAKAAGSIALDSGSELPLPSEKQVNTALGTAAIAAFRGVDFVKSIFSGDSKDPAIQAAEDTLRNNRAESQQETPVATSRPVPDRVFDGNPDVRGVGPEAVIRERLAEEEAQAAASTPEALKLADEAFTAGLKKAQIAQEKRATKAGKKAVSFTQKLVSGVWGALVDQVKDNSSPQMLAFLEGTSNDSAPPRADTGNRSELQDTQADLMRTKIESLLDGVKATGKPLTAKQQIELLQLRLGILIAEQAPQAEIDAVTQMTNELILKIK